MPKTPASPPAPDAEPNPEEGDHGSGEPATKRPDDGAPQLHSSGFPTFGLRQQATIDPAEFIERKIDGYQVVRLIGRGGMSLVFEAEQKIPQRSVAFKICLPGAFLAQRLEQDAECLKNIDHRGIARVLAGGGLDSSQGRLRYMVTELVLNARTISEYCQHELPGIPERVALFAEVCLAVFHCHARQPSLIHRDLKPGNILVGADGQPKVIDFGIARAATSRSGTTTLTIIGTPGYMSPEQLLGTDAIPANDVFSLGMILKELLHADSRNADPAAPYAATRLTSRASRGLERIIARCVNSDSAQRYADAGHLERALRQWLRYRLPEWLDVRRVAWSGATRRWLAEHRQTILRGGMAAAFVAAAIWTVLIRPDTQSYAAAVAVAAQAARSESSADSQLAIADANRAWRFARPFAPSIPLEITCLKSHVSGAAEACLVATNAEAIAFRSCPDPLAAVGYAGGVALVDISGSAGRLLHRLGNPAPISAVAFSATGTQLIAGDELGRVLIWGGSHLSGSHIDTTPRRIAPAASEKSAVLTIAVPTAVVNQADWCLVLDAGGHITRIDLPRDGKEPRTTLVKTVLGACDIALLEGGRLLAIATDSGTVKFRDLTRPEEFLRSDQVGEGPIDLAHDTAGRVLYAVTPQRLLVWQNPRANPPLVTSLTPDWEGSSPRLVLADAETCIVTRQVEGRASLHCFRDLRGRLDPTPCWRETLTLASTAQVREATLIQGDAPSLNMLDVRGYLITSR